MCDAEGMPEHDICVFDICVGVLGDPFGEAERGGAGGLGDVAAGGMELVVLVYSIG